MVTMAVSARHVRICVSKEMSPAVREKAHALRIVHPDTVVETATSSVASGVWIMSVTSGVVFVSMDATRVIMAACVKGHVLPTVKAVPAGDCEMCAEMAARGDGMAQDVSTGVQSTVSKDDVKKEIVLSAVKKVGGDLTARHPVPYTARTTHAVNTQECVSQAAKPGGPEADVCPVALPTARTEPATRKQETLHVEMDATGGGLVYHVIVSVGSVLRRTVHRLVDVLAVVSEEDSAIPSVIFALMVV